MVKIAPMELGFSYRAFFISFKMGAYQLDWIILNITVSVYHKARAIKEVINGDINAKYISIVYIMFKKQNNSTSEITTGKRQIWAINIIFIE